MAGLRHARADSGGLRHIGRFFDDVVHKTGFRAIAFQLERAAGSGGHEVVAAFKEVAGIRHQLAFFLARLIFRRLKEGKNNAPR